MQIYKVQLHSFWIMDYQCIMDGKAYQLCSPFMLHPGNGSFSRVAAKPWVKQPLQRLVASCQMSCVLPMFQRSILLLKDKTPSEQSETHMQTRGLKKLPIEMKVVGTIWYVAQILAFLGYKWLPVLQLLVIWEYHDARTSKCVQESSHTTEQESHFSTFHCNMQYPCNILLTRDESNDAPTNVVSIENSCKE